MTLREGERRREERWSRELPTQAERKAGKETLTAGKRGERLVERWRDGGKK